jgi:predicted trehalose synthase
LKEPKGSVVVTQTPIPLAEYLGLSALDPVFFDLKLYVAGSRWYLGDPSSPLSFNCCGTRVLGQYLRYLEVVVAEESGRLWNLPTLISSAVLEGRVMARFTDGSGMDVSLYDATSNRLGREVILGPLGVGLEMGVDEDKVFDQSNTSFFFGDLYVKLYRQLMSHKNREISVLEALTQSGSTDVPKVLGYGETCSCSSYLVLESMGDARDLYALAKELLSASKERVLELYLRRVGLSLRRLHRNLRDVFGTVSILLSSELDRSWSRTKNRMDLIKQELGAEPKVSPSAAAKIFASKDEVRQRDSHKKIDLQVVHGDLHLGQVLIGNERLVFIDFEGEVLGEVPTKRSSIEYDLAGIARSIHYAVSETLGLGTFAATMMSRSLEKSFLDAYVYGDEEDCADGPYTARLDLDLYETLKLEKAVYELEYEIRAGRGLKEIPAAFLRGYGEQDG